MPTSSSKKIIILGIDPGLADTGYGVIEKTKSQITSIDFGCINTKAGVPDEQRLVEIHKSINQLIKKYKPDIIAVEKLFFGKNVKTAMSVSKARGVIILAVGKNKSELVEHTPLQVKQALTGYGQASKDQVKAMVKIILNLDQAPKSDDAADALAIAICCANSRR